MIRHIGQKIYATDRIRSFEDITTEWKVAAICETTISSRSEYQRLWKWFGEFHGDPKARMMLQRGMYRPTVFHPEPDFSAVQGLQLTETGERWHLYVRVHPYAGQRMGKV